MHASRIALAPLALVTLVACGGAGPEPEESATGTTTEAVEATPDATSKPVTIPSPFPTVQRCIPCLLPPRLSFQITFDTIPSGTIVDTYFAGVTFAVVTWINGQGWTVDPTRHVYAVAVPYPPAGSAPNNALTIARPPFQAGAWPPLFVAATGAIQVTFAQPVSTVSISAETIYSGAGSAGSGTVSPLNLPFMDVWGAPATGGALFLGQVVETVGASGIGGFNEWTPITDAPGSPIGSVILGVQNVYDTGTANVLFDTLTYS